MKKLLAGLLTAAMLPAAAAYAAEDIKILIDGEEMVQKGQKAVIENDITMIPFRDIFESLDAHVDWIPSTKTIVAVKGLTSVKMQIDSDKIYVNGEEKTVPAAPSLINDTTMVPLRAVSEILESEVDWDMESRIVSVTLPETKTEHKSETKYYTKELNNDEGELLLKVIVAYPVFDAGVSDGLDEINALYKTHSEEFADEAVKQFSEMIQDDYVSAADEDRIFEPMVVVYGYEIAYDKFNFLSLVEQAGVAGGDVFYFDSVTFNTENADILKKEDFVDMSDAEMMSLEPYSFYLYDDKVVLSLNSNNIYLYQYNNYPPSMVVPEDNLKYNLATGEKNAAANNAESSENTSVSIANPRVEYSKLYELNNALDFKMAEFKDQIKNVPVSYASINNEIGEIIYSRDSGSATVNLRKSRGDADISGIYGAEKYQEELYKNSMIEFYKNDSCAYASFAVETDNGIYSYSIMTDNLSDTYALVQLSKEIIDGEL